MKKFIAIAAILAVPSLAMATEAANFAVEVGVGTTGLDAAVTYKLTDNVNLRGIYCCKNNLSALPVPAIF